MKKLFQKKSAKWKKESFGSKVFDLFNILFMLLTIFVCFYPFWYIFIVSINDNSVSSWVNVMIWPKAITWDNFRVVLESPDLVSGFRISIFRTIIGTTLSVVLGGAMAYALSRRELVGRKFFNIFILITMYLGGGIIPTYMLYRKLELLNTFSVLIVSGLFSTWYIILMRTYFSSLPDGLIESAKIDGANDLYIYFRIVMPVSKPIYATITLFTAVNYWNDWFAGDMYISSDSLQPIQTIMMRIINDMQASEMLKKSAGVVGTMGGTMVESVKMATVLLTVIPIVIIYPFLQKHFVKGIMIGSLKG